MSQSYHLQVTGTLWSGGRACHQYSVTRADADSLLAQHAEPEAFAGDFQAVHDWRLVSESNSYESAGRIARRVDTFKTLRGFRGSMTPQRFSRMINGH